MTVAFALALPTNKSPIFLGMLPNVVGHVVLAYVAVTLRHSAFYGSVLDFVSARVASTLLVWTAFLANWT